MYKLHANENIFPNSYMVLEGMINELDQFEGLLATSMFMMPKRPERRRLIYDGVLAHGAALHFVLEDFVIRTALDIEPVEEILSIHNLLAAAPKTISDENAASAGE